MKLLLILMVLPVLAGCAGPAEPKWAPEAEVTRATYTHEGPATITLFTVVNNNSGAGAHSALMVNSSHRAIFDPAGTWYHPNLPERNDVHFGMTDAAVDFYVDYHSRIKFRTVIQEIPVSPEVARMAMNEIMAYGAVPKAQCSVSVTRILSKLPGFEHVPRTWFPNQVSRAIAAMPGVKTEVIYDNDPTNNTGFVEAYGI